MFRVVSVSTGLDSVKAHLTSSGYQVVDMDGHTGPVEAVVYQGPQIAAGSTARALIRFM